MFSAVFVLACSAASATPPDITGLGYQQKLGAVLPLDRVFRGEGGEPLSLRSAIGDRPTLLILGYFACPSLCGAIRDDTLSAISRTGLGLVAGRDYTLLFLSIDATETPRMATSAKSDDLRLYPAAGATAGWRFLTGRQDDIDAVEAAVGFHARYSVALKQFLHPAGVVILTPAGRVSSYLLGIGFEPAKVQVALDGARRGRTERSDNPILLLCFHYDASVGLYTLDILKTLRVAGVLTVLGIGGVVMLTHRLGGGRRSG